MNQRIKELEDKIERRDSEMTICITIMVFLAVCLLVSAIYIDDNVDVDDSLAPFMCGAYNRSVVSVKTNLGFGNLPPKPYLEIVCGEKERQLEDGYLLVVGDVT